MGSNHLPGAAGNKLVPDLATSVPKPTDGGKTYTFKLKSGVKFAPPVNRAVTSQDVKYALQRLANPKNGGQYALLLLRHRRLGQRAKGKNVSGITTPNASTLVIKLTKPRGDFLYAMSMPATARSRPRSASASRARPARTAATSSRPARTCSTARPTSTSPRATRSSRRAVSTARRSWTSSATRTTTQKTDSKAARENFPDEFKFVVNANADDILNKIEAGEYDTATTTSRRSS